MYHGCPPASILRYLDGHIAFYLAIHLFSYLSSSSCPSSGFCSLFGKHHLFVALHFCRRIRPDLESGVVSSPAFNGSHTSRSSTLLTLCSFPGSVSYCYSNQHPLWLVSDQASIRCPDKHPPFWGRQSCSASTSNQQRKANNFILPRSLQDPF